MKGRACRRKGIGAEREWAALIGGHRVPLSGAQAGYPGDVIGPDGRIWEVKRREAGFKQLYQWLEKADALALRSSNKPWLVVTKFKEEQCATDGGKQGSQHSSSQESH